MSFTVTLIGGPTTVLDFDGFRVVTDPTFDEPREYHEAGAPVTLVKTAPPALSAAEIGPVELVLASHEHEDNLDHEGRAFLAAAPLAFTTPAAAEHYGDNVRGLADYESATVMLSDQREMTVTAVPAHHGPKAIREVGGPVAGFVLSGPGLPTVYVSGDNSDVELVGEIRDRMGVIDVAVLFAGGAWFDELGPGVELTLGNQSTLAVAELLPEAMIIPAHVDSWAHLHDRVDDMRRLFEERGRQDRLRVLEPGESVLVGTPGR